MIPPFFDSIAAAGAEQRSMISKKLFGRLIQHISIGYAAKNTQRIENMKAFRICLLWPKSKLFLVCFFLSLSSLSLFLSLLGERARACQLLYCTMCPYSPACSPQEGAVSTPTLPFPSSGGYFASQQEEPPYVQVP